MSNSKTKVDIKIKRALISISDKTGIVPFVQSLKGLGVEILSTGGTAKLLKENNIPVTEVSSHTGFPEIMDGRVKTLHPRIHGGLLGLRDNPSHVKEARENDIDWIDMVVVNLYPFEKTIAKKDVSIEEAIENIDVGGPSMLRSAAKNHRFVVVVTDISDYDRVLSELRKDGDVSFETRRELALKVYQKTSAYDKAISAYLARQFSDEPNLDLHFIKGKKLRYGENSHQESWAYQDADCQESSLLFGEVLHGKDMSYNNYVDGDAALDAVKELWSDHGAAIVKHTNPCGFATGENQLEALGRAWAGDPVSAFGSVIALTRTVDLETARFLKGKFVEALIAPGFDKDALEFLENKSKNIRLIKIKDYSSRETQTWTYKKITGGILAQTRDWELFEKFDVVTKAGFSDNQKQLAEFAYKACKHTKSNAIVIARMYKEGFFQVMGMGAGQPNRIDSLQKLSINRAKDNLKAEFDLLKPKISLDEYQCSQLKNMVMASDAFFPFDDTVRAAGKIGLRFIVQPGGSKKDGDSVSACDELGIAMAFTGKRHFKH